MKANRFMGTVAAIMLGAGLVSAVHGDEGSLTGVYVGGSVGYATFTYLDDNSDRCEETPGSMCSIDDNALAYSVYGGFEFSPRFAIEAGWTGHEELEFKGFGTPCGDVRGDSSSWSVYGAAMGRMPTRAGRITPLERITPFAKAGVYYWEVEGSGAYCEGSDPVHFTSKDDGYALLVGAGMDVELTRRTSFRAEWTWFTESAGEVHAFLGGINFKF